MSATLALPAPAPAPAAIDAWRAALDSLDAQIPPCPGFSYATWPEVFASMHAFLDEWGEAAAAAGWRLRPLFGVHRVAGAIRVDACGALIFPRAYRVVSVAPDLIRFASGLANRGLTNARESVPIWKFDPANGETP